MYFEYVDRLSPGQVVAQAVHADDGTVLLGAGTVLDERLIAGARRRGLLALPIADGMADDIAPSGAVRAETRMTTALTLRRVVEGAHQATLRTTSEDGDPAGAATTAARLGDRELPLDDATRQAWTELTHGVEQLIEEVLEHGAGGSLESLKSHSTYTFEHSVDVAVTATLLGHLAGLQREELSTLALGGLLHDLGKTFIDLVVLDKPGPLTREERAEIERHPRLGFELVKRMPVASVLPAHIALQHHERQDGHGYPNGLDGANRLERRSAERWDPRRMLLLAEVCAVADVHSALASDRPYRPALPPERVHGVLGEMAGGHLNAELVRLLQSSVPAFTIGRWVEIVGGRYHGWRGVVSALGATALDPPTVRLHLLPDGSAASGAPEVEMASQAGALLKAVPRGHPACVERRLDVGWTPA